MTSEKTNLKELIKSLISLFLTFIGIEFLAAIASIPFTLLINKTLNLSGESYENFSHLVMNCIFQLLAIYFFYKIYRDKGFNLIQSKTKLNLKTLGQYSIITFGASTFDYLWLLLATTLSSYSSFLKNSLADFSSTMSFLDENTLLSFISVVILAPIIEELIFRGIVFNEASKYKRGAFPIILSSLLFGLAHMQPIQIVYTSIFGIILGLIYNKTHSLAISIFIHMLSNLLSFLPESLESVLIALSVICFIPMILLLRNLYKPNKNKPHTL